MRRFFDSKKQPTDKVYFKEDTVCNTRPAPADKEYFEEDTVCNTSLEPDPGRFDMIWKLYTQIPTNKALDCQTAQVNVLSENLREDRKSLVDALQKHKENTDKLQQVSEQLQKLRIKSHHHNDIAELERQIRELNREIAKLEPYIKQLREQIATGEQLIIKEQGTLENPTYAKYYQSCS